MSSYLPTLIISVSVLVFVCVAMVAVDRARQVVREHPAFPGALFAITIVVIVALAITHPYAHH